MVLKGLFASIVSLVACMLAGNQAFAQFYYAVPQYQRPIMFVEPPMIHSLGTGTDEFMTTDAGRKVMPIKGSLVVPTRRTSAVLQDTMEELPAHPDSSYQISGSQLGSARQEASQIANSVFGRGSACGTCDLTSAGSTAFHQQLGGAPQHGVKIPDCKDGAVHILDFPGVEAMADCCPDCTTGNCDDDLIRWKTKEAALSDPRCDPECLVCVKEPFICQKEVMEEAEVVFFRCYERIVPFHDVRCEDQRCIKEEGKRTVKKLEPCTVTIKFPCKKTVIDYCDVWICIKCDCRD